MSKKYFDRSICDRIIEWFINTDYAKEMDNCLNGLDENTPNPYHQERSVLDHSLMVASEAIKHWRDDKNFYIYFLAGLVHDIGKIRARSVEKRRKDSDELMCIFRNHENMGLYFAAEVLINFWKTDMAREISFNYKNYCDILKLVVYHDIYKYEPEEAFEMYGDFAKKIAKFSICDTRGRLMDEPRDLSKYESIINNESIDDTEEENIFRFSNSNLYNIGFLVGLPSSGKSSLVKIASINTNIISRDRIIEDLDYYLSLENIKKIINKSILDKLLEISTKYEKYGERFEELHFKNNYGKYIDEIFMHLYHKEILSCDSNIIIDKTNLSKKGRKKLLTFNTKNNVNVSNRVLESNFKKYDKYAYVIVRPYSSIIKSDIRRGRKAGKYVIDNFLANSNIPNKKEFADVFYCTPCLIGDLIKLEGPLSELILDNILCHLNKDGIAYLSVLDNLDIDGLKIYMEMYDDYMKFVCRESYVKMKYSI